MQKRLAKAVGLMCTISTAFAAQAQGSGKGHFSVDGHRSDFQLIQCVVIAEPGKGARLELIGREGDRQISVTSNGLNDRYRLIHDASIRLDQDSPAFHASYRLTDDGWLRQGDTAAEGPLISYEGERLVVEGKFKRLGSMHSQPAVTGRIEAECPTLTTEKIAMLKGQAIEPGGGEPSGTVAVDGRSGEFKPGTCTLMQLSDNNYILNLSGEGDALEIGINSMRFSDARAQQRVQISMGDDMWLATRVQNEGEWGEVNGDSAPGPLVTIEGKRITAAGEFRLHGAEERTAQARLEAYCPGMTTLSSD